jgi:hypothetical protein
MEFSITLDDLERTILLLIVIGNAIQSWGVGNKVDEIHKNTNSLVEAMMDMARKEGHAAGLKEGRAEERR